MENILDRFEPRTIFEIERDLVIKSLRFFHGNRTRTAKSLGITLNTLRNKMIQYDVAKDFRRLNGRPLRSNEPGLPGASNVLRLQARHGSSDIRPTTPFEAPERRVLGLGAPAEAADFIKNVDDVIATKSVRWSRFAVLAIDFDQNDTQHALLGSELAEQSMFVCGMILQANLGEGASMAKTGRSTFHASLTGVSSLEQARAAIDELYQRLLNPIDKNGRPVIGEVRIGFACHPDHGNRASELVNAAFLALTSTRSKNSDDIAMFSPVLREALGTKLAEKTRIRRAIADCSIIPFYQPKIDLATGGIVGFEALLRQSSPMDGMRTPLNFPEVFEDRHLAKLLADRMRKCIKADIKQWVSTGTPFAHVAVNAAAAELDNANYCEELVERLQLNDIDRDMVQFEVTERVLAGSGAARARRTLRQLVDAGFKVTLDNFGLGFASLTVLNDLSIKQVKIDRGLTQRLESDVAARRIVASTIKAALDLDMSVAAAGVEGAGQVSILKGMGCQVAQGYLFGKPMRARHVREFVRNHESGFTNDDIYDNRELSNGERVR